MQLYFVQVEIDGYVAEVFFNGAPLIGSPSGTKHSLIQVNHWLIDGSNAIEVLVRQVRPRRQESAAETFVDNSSLTVFFGQGDESHLSCETPFEVLTSLVETTLPGDERSLPYTVRAVAGVKSPFPVWRWQRSERLPATDDMLRGAIAFVANVYGIVAARDLARLEELAAVTFEEIAPAYRYSPDTARAEFRKSYQWLFSQPNFALAPLDPHEIDFRSCCEGRLLDVRTRGGEAAVRQQGMETNGGWFLPLMIGKVDGRWAILR